VEIPHETFPSLQFVRDTNILKLMEECKLGTRSILQ